MTYLLIFRYLQVVKYKYDAFLQWEREMKRRGSFYEGLAVVGTFRSTIWVTDKAFVVKG